MGAISMNTIAAASNHAAVTAFKGFFPRVNSHVRFELAFITVSLYRSCGFRKVNKCEDKAHFILFRKRRK